MNCAAGKGWKNVDGDMKSISVRKLNKNIYSVMQSDKNSFYGDVVLKSFRKASRDKDSILNQKNDNRKYWDLYYGDFNLKSD